MQLNECITKNTAEICSLFNLSPEVISGKCTADEYACAIKTSVIPVLTAIECALNKNYLLEREKKTLYFAFDTKEMLKGDIVKRYQAYQIAIQSNIMQIDEVRYIENLKPLGLDFVKIGLADVLFYPDTGMIYTPNTNKMSKMNQESDEKTSEDTTININETDGTVSQVSLNGAQIQSLLQIVTAVAGNTLQYDSAIVLITSAFPFDTETAKKILGNPAMLEVIPATDSPEESINNEQGGADLKLNPKSEVI